MLALMAAGLSIRPASADDARHGIAMHGMPALAKDFAHLPYANPDAPKGGRLVLGLQGTFDSFNPFIIKGVVPHYITGNVIQSLMLRSVDETFTLYGQIARRVVMPEDRSFVTFEIDQRARFSTGDPLTARDVLFSFEILREKGRPGLRNSYRRVDKASLVGDTAIRFDLASANDRELPLILGLMPIFSQKHVNSETFDQTSLSPPIGSGPYVIVQVDPGKSFTLKRNPDYWAKDLPISRGLYNFDEIRVDLYLDANSLFEAFKAGQIDLRFENDPAKWMTGYDIAAVRQGRIQRESVPIRIAKPMTGFVFNTRSPLFADIRLREALASMLDFDWINQNLYFGAYTRTGSFFEGSEFSARGIPASAHEKHLLNPFPDAVRPEVMEGTWQPPAADGSGRDRALTKRALDLLEQAGLRLDGDTMRLGDGKAFAFDLMVQTRPQERLALVYAQSLKRIGIEAKVRLRDESQYWKRLRSYEFDMAHYSWNPSLSPGNEQIERWSSDRATVQGSLNFAGVRSPAADAMLKAILAARDKSDHVDAVRALDRILLSGFYVVPLFHLRDQWLARQSGIRWPNRSPLFGTSPELMWREA